MTTYIKINGKLYLPNEKAQGINQIVGAGLNVPRGCAQRNNNLYYCPPCNYSGIQPGYYAVYNNPRLEQYPTGFDADVTLANPTGNPDEIRRAIFNMFLDNGYLKPGSTFENCGNVCK